MLYSGAFSSSFQSWQVFFITIIKQYISIMGNILYLVAVILVIGWAVGFFGYNATGIIHVLLVIAIIAVLLNIIRSSKS